MSDSVKINDVIQLYFDSMFESNSQKFHQAFHPNAKITGYTADGLQEMDVSVFADFVASQLPSAKEKGDIPVLEIVSLDVAGNTAVAKVRDEFIGLTFLDILSFIRIGDEWQIYNKLFHVES